MTDNQFKRTNRVREYRIKHLKELGWKQDNWNKWYDPRDKKEKHYRLHDAYKAAKAKAIIS